MTMKRTERKRPMPKYRKRPVIVEAIQFLGKENLKKCLEFSKPSSFENEQIRIETMFGYKVCPKSHWIVFEDKRVLIVSDSIFRQTYQEVKEND
jgi:hypothetical protein